MPIAIGTYNQDYDFYYTEEFKVLVRSERESLLKSASERTLLSRNEVQMYRYDFYRLLRSMGVPLYLHWVTAYLNNIEDPFKDIAGMEYVLIPSESALENSIVRKNTTRS